MSNYPILLNIWLEDEEVPAACNVLFEHSAKHYLKVEAAGTVAAFLLYRIKER